MKANYRMNKNGSMKISRYLVTLFLAFLFAEMYAQQEEVRVVKPYTPTLSGAEKIQLMPGIEDTVSYNRPALEYSIFPNVTRPISA